MYRRELFENDKPSRLERFLEAGVFFTGMIGWGGLLALVALIVARFLRNP